MVGDINASNFFSQFGVQPTHVWVHRPGDKGQVFEPHRARDGETHNSIEAFGTLPGEDVNHRFCRCVIYTEWRDMKPQVSNLYRQSDSVPDLVRKPSASEKNLWLAKMRKSRRDAVKLLSSLKRLSPVTGAVPFTVSLVLAERLLRSLFASPLVVTDSWSLVYVDDESPVSSVSTTTRQVASAAPVLVNLDSGLPLTIPPGTALIPVGDDRYLIDGNIVMAVKETPSGAPILEVQAKAVID